MMARSRRSTTRPNTLMQLSRSSVCQHHLATHGRTIQMARLRRKRLVRSGTQCRRSLRRRNVKFLPRADSSFSTSFPFATVPSFPFRETTDCMGLGGGRFSSCSVRPSPQKSSLAAEGAGGSRVSGGNAQSRANRTFVSAPNLPPVRLNVAGDIDRIGAPGPVADLKTPPSRGNRRGSSLRS
jgi:hypothetical protein